MKQKLSHEAFAQLFVEASTFNKFSDREVTDAVIVQFTTCSNGAPMSGFNNAAVEAEFFPDGRFKSSFLINLGYGEALGNYPRGPRLDFDVAYQII